MNDPLQTIFELNFKNNLFPQNSRYYGIETSTMKTQDGKTVIYLRRRFVPQPEMFALLQEHSVQQDDRLDNLAAKYFGDPLLFWRICDANSAIKPDELIETIGKILRITLPEGISGAISG
jgi:hypothetical protein